MSLILCIETGTDICSVALARGGEIVALKESDPTGRDHARLTATFTDELLQQTGVKPEELTAVAVGKGPGSYTGLRIGVSFAKGLCFGLDIPLVAVGSLDALVEVALMDYAADLQPVAVPDPLPGIVFAPPVMPAPLQNAFLCPMIDARRMEVYAQVFDAQGNPLTPVTAEIITPDSFATWRGIGVSGALRGVSEEDAVAGRPFVIFGNGAEKCLDLLPDAVMIDVRPSARGLARLAQEALDAGRTEDIAYFEPFYLKDFVVTSSKKKVF